MKKNIFSKILVAMALVVAPIAMSSCSNEDNFWTEAVTISGKGVQHHEASITIGETLQLRASNGILVHGTGFRWESSDESIATVDANGLVKGIKGGIAVITAHTTGNSQISYQGSITLTVKNLGVSSVDDKLNQSLAE